MHAGADGIEGKQHVCLVSDGGDIILLQLKGILTENQVVCVQEGLDRLIVLPFCQMVVFQLPCDPYQTKSSFLFGTTIYIQTNKGYVIKHLSTNSNEFNFH